MTTGVLVLARTLHIGSAMVLFALPFFIHVILRPVFAAGADEGFQSFCRRLIKWLWVAWILEAVSGGVWFWFVIAQMSDESPWDALNPSDLNKVLWQTQFGWLWLERTAVGAALGVALFFVSRRKIVVASRLLFLDWLLLALSGCLLITLAWAGHAAAGIHDQVLHLLADTLHLLIGAIWPMGLIPFVCFLWDMGKRDQASSTERDISVLQRFSQTSLIAVLTLVFTGFINSWLMIGTWEALVTTDYGRLLLGKVSIVGIMIGLGGYNRLCLLPRIHDAPIMLRALRRTTLVESCLALIVLFIVGIMGMTSPPS